MPTLDERIDRLESALREALLPDEHARIEERERELDAKFDALNREREELLDSRADMERIFRALLPFRTALKRGPSKRTTIGDERGILLTAIYLTDAEASRAIDALDALMDMAGRAGK